MLGYKVYFDGNKFTMEEQKTTVENTASDSTTHWNAEYITACAAVEELNSKLKQSIDELIHDKDFVIKTCKDCNEYFIITTMYADWFLSRNLSIPCRCDNCRRKRKIKYNQNSARK